MNDLRCWNTHFFHENFDNFFSSKTFWYLCKHSHRQQQHLVWFFLSSSSSSIQKILFKNNKKIKSWKITSNPPFPVSMLLCNSTTKHHLQHFNVIFETLTFKNTWLFFNRSLKMCLCFRLLLYIMTQSDNCNFKNCSQIMFLPKVQCS